MRWFCLAALCIGIVSTQALRLPSHPRLADAPRADGALDAAAPAPAGRRPECMWNEFHRSGEISAWEFQLQPRRHMIRDRQAAISKVEKLLRRLSGKQGSGVKFEEGSMWMTIFEEVSYLATTRHGRPLHKERAHGEKHPFPWRGVGYLRLRKYRITVPEGVDVPTAVPGSADLTFKMKKVDPKTKAGPLKLPETAGPRRDAKLTAKVENDMHCDHQRDTMSPLYRPVPQDLDITKCSSVKEYFPNLAEVALLDAEERLPFMHTVHRAKIVWTVMFEGLRGEANLVIKYNTTYEDALLGRNPKNGEISVRIRREKAGPAPEEALARGLRAVGGAAQAFRDAGWDGKTGPWGDRGQVVEEEEEQERDEQEEDGKEDEEAEVEEQEGSDGATGQAGGPAAGGRGGARGKGSWAAGLWRVLEV